MNHEDAAIDRTPGDTTVITNKDDNDELIVDDSRPDSSNTMRLIKLDEDDINQHMMHLCLIHQVKQYYKNKI